MVGVSVGRTTLRLTSCCVGIATTAVPTLVGAGGVVCSSAAWCCGGSTARYGGGGIRRCEPQRLEVFGRRLHPAENTSEVWVWMPSPIAVVEVVVVVSPMLVVFTSPVNK